MHDIRIKERLSCKMCLEYDVPSFGGLHVAKPFQCLFNVFIFFILNVKPLKIAQVLSMFIFCGSKLCNQYKHLYHYECNLDGTVTRIGIDTSISATISSSSLPNDSNPYQI